MHRAVELMESTKLVNFLFPSSQNLKVKNILPRAFVVVCSFLKTLDELFKTFSGVSSFLEKLAKVLECSHVCFYSFLLRRCPA